MALESLGYALIFILIAVLLFVLQTALIFGAPMAFYRHLRIRSLKNVTLSQSEIDSLRAKLLDYVKDQSYNQGVLVPLSKFWRDNKVRNEGDKANVLYVLLAKRVLLARGNPRLIWFERYVSMPVRSKVYLSEREWQRMVHGEKGAKIIQQLIGDGNTQSLNVETGNIAGDRVGGDKTGRDKAARSVNDSNFDQSFNRDSSWTSASTITSVDELAHEMRRLASEARARGVDAAICDTLEWGAANAMGPEPSLADFSRRHRILATAGVWIRERLTQLVDASTGALGGAGGTWVLDLLR